MLNNTHAKPDTLRTAEAAFEVISNASGPISAVDICKEFNMPRGRHNEVSHALKLLRHHGKIEMVGGRKSAKYVAANGVKVSLPLTEAEQREQLAVPPVPVIKPKREKPSPIRMVEVPYATLKVVVKAVMQCCTPMDSTLQRATLQCMEKLI
jgi:hypothetical protein